MPLQGPLFLCVGEPVVFNVRFDTFSANGEPV